MSKEPSEDVKALQQQIDFGFQVEAFLHSEIGQYLIRRAEMQIDGAVEQLKRCDPEDAKQIRSIQNQIQVAEDLQYWLAEAIQAGVNAQSEFVERY